MLEAFSCDRTAVGLIVIRQPLGGNLAPTLGLATAGLAFALQAAIGDDPNLSRRVAIPRLSAANPLHTVQ